MLLHPGPAALHHASSAAEMQDCPCPQWKCLAIGPANVAALSQSVLPPQRQKKCPTTLLPYTVVILRAGIPWRTKPNQQRTPGCKSGEPHLPHESGVCPPYWRPQTHLPCPPPTTSQPLWGVYTMPRSTGAQQHQPHDTPLCQGIFFNCSQTVSNL